jgi:hypothetical protein
MARALLADDVPFGQRLFDVRRCESAGVASVQSGLDSVPRVDAGAAIEAIISDNDGVFLYIHISRLQVLVASWVAVNN